MWVGKTPLGLLKRVGTSCWSTRVDTEVEEHTLLWRSTAGLLQTAAGTPGGRER